MRQAHPRRSIPAASGLIGCLLLAACTSAATSATPPARGSSGTAGADSRPSDAAPSVGSSSAGSSPAARAAAADACALVTEHEAGVALGSDPGAGQAITAHGGSSCTYGTSPAIVTVNLLTTGGRDAYDHARGLVPAGRIVDVPGVGTAAFGVFTGPAAEVWFYQGDSMVSLGLITGAAAVPPRAEATTLARIAAGRV